MELYLPTPVSRPPSLEWRLRTVQQTLPGKVAAGKVAATLEPKQYLVVGPPRGTVRHSREGGRDTGVGRSSSI